MVESMRLSVEASAAHIEASRAQLAFTETDLARVRQLAATGVLTREDQDRAQLEHIRSAVSLRQSELVHAASAAMLTATELMPPMIEQYIDRKELSVEVLRRQHDELQARLDEVRRDQRRGAMTSPIDGLVLHRELSDEQFVAAGTTIMELGRLDDLEIEVEVLSTDAVTVRPGQAVEVYGPAVGSPAVRAAVLRVEPAGFTKISSLGVEEQRVRVIVRLGDADLARLIGQRGLGVGDRVRARIFTAEKPDALIVPRSALFRGADEAWQLYAVRRGRTVLLTVGVGLMNDREAEVVEGIEAGDAVVFAPETGLTDGAKVTPVPVGGA